MRGTSGNRHSLPVPPTISLPQWPEWDIFASLLGYRDFSPYAGQDVVPHWRLANCPMGSLKPPFPRQPRALDLTATVHNLLKAKWFCNLLLRVLALDPETSVC